MRPSIYRDGFCHYNHDTKITGRYKGSICKACHAEGDPIAQAIYKARKRSWSRYMCVCFAIQRKQCVCSCNALEEKRVFFKDLERRNLNALFNKSSEEHIKLPINYTTYMGLRPYFGQSK